MTVAERKSQNESEVSVTTILIKIRAMKKLTIVVLVVVTEFPLGADRLSSRP